MPILDTPCPRLENWCLVNPFPEAERYKSPLQKTKVIVGEVYDHPRHPDGLVITTSELVEVHENEGWVQTKNTRYILGKPSEDYSKFLEEFRSRTR